MRSLVVDVGAATRRDGAIEPPKQKAVKDRSLYDDALLQPLQLV